ncbi:DMT family transporter [Rhodovulum sulfidophilum]|uniref:DMT family transporter n=1 Tax=Rhodovulum sulfidophilum TaxID=35806 RepID=UPI001F33681B|nr:DMT family transporter [Rhodovulum sulfidophilum]
MTSIAETAGRLTMGRAEWAMLLALSVLWGGSFLFVGIAVAELPTLTLVWLRVALAALVLWAAVAATGRRLPRAPRVWAAFLGMGLLNNVIPFSLIVAGQHSIASGLASILNATTPLFTVVVAGLLLADERPGRLQLAGVAAGLAGVAVMIGPDALAGLGTNALAQLAVLGGALSYACAAVFGRRFRHMGVDPLVTAAGQVGAATLLLSPAMLIADRPWTLPMPGAGTCAAVLGLAVLSTALAYLLYFRILARAGATSLSLVTFLIPVSAILLGGLVLDERLVPTDFAGMACIALGLAAVDGRLFRR